MTDPHDAFITALRLGQGEPANYIDQLTDLNAIGPADHTPLGSATFHRRQDLAAILLKRGADPNRVYANGRTPLFGAIARRSFPMVQLLVAHGADVNRGIPAIGHTRLHRAALLGDSQLVEFLVEHGADVNAAGRKKG